MRPEEGVRGVRRAALPGGEDLEAEARRTRAGHGDGARVERRAVHSDGESFRRAACPL